MQHFMYKIDIKLKPIRLLQLGHTLALGFSDYKNTILHYVLLDPRLDCFFGHIKTRRDGHEIIAFCVPGL
jgi:hypothetical protein